MRCLGPIPGLLIRNLPCDKNPLMDRVCTLNVVKLWYNRDA